VTRESASDILTTTVGLRYGSSGHPPGTRPRVPGLHTRVPGFGGHQTRKPRFEKYPRGFAFPILHGMMRFESENHESKFALQIAARPVPIAEWLQYNMSEKNRATFIFWIARWNIGQF